MSKIILIIDFWQTSPHLETSFELAKKHLSSGDKVHFWFCGHDVPYKELIRFKRSSNFTRLCLPENKAASKLYSENFFFHSRVDMKPFEVSINEKFNSIEELREYKYKGAESGLSALSSLLFLTKNSNPDLLRNYTLINKMLSSSATVYEFAIHTLITIKPDLVYIFNGRFVNYRSVMNACQQIGSQFMIHERGSNPEKYYLRPYMPHDAGSIQQNIEEIWNKVPDKSQANVKASDFFIKNRNAISTSWLSFTTGQKKNYLPDLDRNKKIITYFSSSDDEFAAVGDIFEWKYWKNQKDALTSLIRICAKHNDLQLVVRVHPHIMQKSEEDKAYWNSLQIFPGQILIPTDSQIDTYALIERSDIVVTSGSTIGIEAVYWGTPSVCLGPSYYSKLNAVYLPESNLELEKLLTTQLPAPERERALPYGYYFATFGEPFIYYKAKNLFVGEFMGVNLFERGRLCSFIEHLYAVYANIKNLLLKIIGKINKKASNILLRLHRNTKSLN
jgi:hypothetical protein